MDKTGLISELLQDDAAKVTLITRPRRFGKTLAMSMFADFLDIRRNSSSHFDALYISDQKDLCDLWMNQWPVIFFSLKDVDGLDFNTAYQIFFRY